ncbi:MAG: sodium-dependent transporter [Coprococcus sp.]|nr:sodium-dependent transporter [Coprococcus sp.]
MEKKERGSFSGTLGFVMAAAGSAVGLGNIWRFPYLAAKDKGGVFIFIYIILALTFGFALLTTEVAIGRKTQQGPLTAYGKIHKNWKWLGWIAWIVPVIILPYYCTIGGWVLKYITAFFTGQAEASTGDGYFTGFITANVSPIVFGVIFLLITGAVVYGGVEKGIEKLSKILMPILIILIIGISIYSLTIKHTADDGTVRTGLEGLKLYVIPDFSGMTFKDIFMVVMDAMGQLFFSISVAMGIMVAYGSYVKKDVNLMRSINQIEIFDTLVAFLAGLMIVPAVYVFSGVEGMSGGPGLMFISLPKVFNAMGTVGVVVGALFFLMVSFAAITSSVSVMEAIVSGLMDKFNVSRKKGAVITTVYALIGMFVVCFGYNIWYFELKLPNGSTAQILDVMDYISNNILMPVVAILTCVLIGWIVKPKTVIEEVTLNGERFGRKTLYKVMIKVVTPLLLLMLLLQSFGVDILSFISNFVAKVF